MKDNRKTIQVLFILTIIFSVMGGSLAYWNWNTTEGQKTNVVFTVTSDFSCAADGGGNITSNDVMLAPTTCTDTSRAIKRKVTVTPTLNRETMTLSMDLWLTINDLGEGLKKSNNFRYVLTTSSNSCEEGTIMASGNFKGRKVGNKVNLLTNELYTETLTEPEEYWLYIWLDEAETSSSTMNQTFSLSLGGQCEEVETLVGDAYALYSESDKSLTFVRSETPITAGSEYDGKVVTEVYSGIETTNYSSENDVPWISNDLMDGAVIFKDTIRPVSTAYWFSSLMFPSEFNLDNLDTSQVTNMSGMFSYVDVLIDLDLSNFDTSKVKNMSAMFDFALQSNSILGLETWDVSNVENMSGMFYDTGAVGGSDISNWDVSNVTDMSSMFEFAISSSGITLNLSNWNVSNVTDMSSMFSGNSTLNIGNISNWDVSNVKYMSYMFSSATLNSTLDLSGWDVINVSDMSNMFNGCVINTDIGISNWNVSNVTIMESMFRYATINANIGINNWNTLNVRDMSRMFFDTTLNSTLDLSNWNVSNVAYYSWFSNSDKIIVPTWQVSYFRIYSSTDKSIRIYNDFDVPSVGDVYNGRYVSMLMNISGDGGSWSCKSTEIIIVDDNVRGVKPSDAFSWCVTTVNYIDVSKMDVSNLTSLKDAFKNVGSDSSVTSFTIVGLDKWNTSKITDMDNMFYNMGKNANYSLDLSGWDVSKVTSHTDFDYGVESKIIDPLWK